MHQMPNLLNMTKLKTLLITAFIGLSLSVTAQTPDCSTIKNGTFMYNDIVSSSIVVIKKKWHYEYSADKKTMMKSKLEWLNDCEYKATLIKNTRPDMQHVPIGTVMRIRITSVQGDVFNYTGIINGDTFMGSLRKIK
jgi:hypothetical protein